MKMQLSNLLIKLRLSSQIYQKDRVYILPQYHPLSSRKRKYTIYKIKGNDRSNQAHGVIPQSERSKTDCHAFARNYNPVPGLIR